MPDRMWSLVEDLYPICRSITGDGVRATLDRIERDLPAPLLRSEVPTGTQVLDWTVPNEWNIRDAYVARPDGTRVIDFGASNLHVVSYSVPVRERMSLAELRPHLHTLPDLPDWIPYRTSYYAETWGFCLSQRALDALPEDDYEVSIDSTLAPGSPQLRRAGPAGRGSGGGRLLDPRLPSVAGRRQPVVDRRRHRARPGSRVAAAIATPTGSSSRRARSARSPGSPRNREVVPRIRAGLTLTCLGDGSPFTYKRTVGGTAEIDRAAALALRDAGTDHGEIDFYPFGYDERQYNSPGFRAPVGSLMRGRHGRFPEYHTSADSLEFISAENLAESLATVQAIVDVLEGNRTYTNLAPDGEPQLGKRGLYGAIGGTDIPDLNLAMLWVLTLSDGEHDLISIADRSGMPWAAIRGAADLLRDGGLLADGSWSAT